MKKTLLILISLIPYLTFGGPTRKQNNIPRYFEYIKKAEACIVSDNFKQAEYYYDTAFQSCDKPFAVDIYNYLKCANIDSDYLTVKLLALRLVRLGCPLTYFENPAYLTEFRRTTEWQSLINEYVATNSDYVKNIDWKLRATIQQLVVKDQLLRRQDHYTYLKDSIYKMDDAIKRELLNIVNKKFPNEYDFGVFLKNDTDLCHFHPLEIVLLHNYGKFDTKDVPNSNQTNIDFTEILQTAVKHGDLAPETFAFLNDRSGKYMIDKGFGQADILLAVNRKLYYHKDPPESIEKIDHVRSEFYLCNQEMERNKLLYMKAKNKTKFLLSKAGWQITGDDDIPPTALNNFYIYTGVSLE